MIDCIVRCFFDGKEYHIGVAVLYESREQVIHAFPDDQELISSFGSEIIIRTNGSEIIENTSSQYDRYRFELALFGAVKQVPGLLFRQS